MIVPNNKRDALVEFEKKLTEHIEEIKLNKEFWDKEKKNAENSNNIHTANYASSLFTIWDNTEKELKKKYGELLQ